jgi:DNA polymerase-3 subunit chi
MKVDFYILETSSRQAAWHFACSLIEKAYADQQHVYVHTPSKEEAERMDALLWTYKDDSFLPHLMTHQVENNPPPILIGYDNAPTMNKQLLVNLTQDIPPFYSEFSHLIEIVFSDPIVQQLARNRFRQYRESGCELNTHKIS